MAETRRRLAKLVCIRGVSDSSLAAVLTALQGQVVPEASRREISHAAFVEYDAEISEVLKLPLSKGGDFEWYICRPTILVQRCVRRSPALRRLFARVSSTPGDPWHIVLAHDEVTPGAVLRPFNKRKFVGFYMSFLQLGFAALRHEICWFPLAILRTCILDTVEGHLSCAVGALLRAIFLRDGSNFLQGIVLDLDSGPTMLFARFQAHLGDEAGLSKALVCKGAAGFRPCFKCGNVLKKQSEVAGGGSGLVEIDCLDDSLFVHNTDEEVWRQFDAIVAAKGVVTKGELETMQKAAGLTAVANGVLSDPELRGIFKPVSSHTYDWMHTWLSNGVVSAEVYNFLNAVKAAGIADVYSKLEAYCQAAWCSPVQHRELSRNIHVMFCKARENASKDHWRSTASELLTGLPLLRHFAEQIVAIHIPAVRANLDSLCLCCRVVDLLQDTKGGTINVPLLRRAIVEHLRKHASVYGSEAWVPKLHFALHVPQQVQRDQGLLDCFVVERSHLLPKLIATEIKNPVIFEKSAIARILLTRLEDLEKFCELPGLLGNDAAISPELSEALGADTVLAAGGHFDGIQVYRDDVLLVDGYTFQLSAVCKSGDRFFLLGCLFDLVRNLSASSAVWRKQALLHLLPLRGQRVRRCHFWSQRSDGTWLTLHPVLS